MKILLVYPGTRHSTYDVAHGYFEALGELGHSVIAYPYHDYIDYHHGGIEYCRANNPNFVLDRDQQQQLTLKWASEPLVMFVVQHHPELILIVSGLTLHKRGYDLIQRFNIPRALILTESPYIDRTQGDMVKYAAPHLIFTNDKNSVAAMEKFTRTRTVYLPHSYSPKHHYPGVAGEAYQTDVYFHGTAWPERQALFGALEYSLNGHHTRIVGVGWQDGVGNMQYITPNDELAEYYRGTKLALNHHRTITTVGEKQKHIVSGDAHSIGPRAYEIAACGAFQLCDDTRPELAEVFGDSVATYSDAVDLQAKVDYYLGHDHERREMAEEALNRVIPCSFLSRAEQIVLPAARRYL